MREKPQEGPQEDQKTERQWLREVTTAFGKWKRDREGDYDKFRKWNNYHKDRYLESKSHEVSMSERVQGLIYG